MSDVVEGTGVTLLANNSDPATDEDVVVLLSEKQHRTTNLASKQSVHVIPVNCNVNDVTLARYHDKEQVIVYIKKRPLERLEILQLTHNSSVHGAP